MLTPKEDMEITGYTRSNGRFCQLPSSSRTRSVILEIVSGRPRCRTPRPVGFDLTGRQPLRRQRDHHRIDPIEAALVLAHRHRFEGPVTIPRGVDLHRAEWETLAATYSLDCWFCEPHSPWQRGQIENLNRQFRFWFPRGTDLGVVARADADHAANIVNRQRRRGLNNTSPADLYAALTVQ